MVVGSNEFVSSVVEESSNGVDVENQFSEDDMKSLIDDRSEVELKSGVVDQNESKSLEACEISGYVLVVVMGMNAVVDRDSLILRRALQICSS